MTTNPSADDYAEGTLAEDATLWDRKMKALTLRNAGATYARIAEQLGLRSHLTARTYVKDAIKEVVAIPVDAMVDRQRAILLDLQRVNYHDAMNGNKESQGVILRCLEHEAKLYGLYAPTRVALGVNSDEFGLQALELLKVVGPEPLRELAGIIKGSQVADMAPPPEPDYIEAEVIPDVHETAESPAVTDDGGASDPWSNL
jgi:hypothetical protein